MMNSRGSAAKILLVLVAVVACAMGALAAFALRGDRIAAGGRGDTPAHAPASDVLAVGSGGGGGSAAAVPASYAWLDRSENVLALSQGGPVAGGTPADTTTQAAGPPTDAGPSLNPGVDTPPPAATVPKVVGKGYEEAGSALGAAGLDMQLKDKRRSTTIPVGRIATQSPDPGTSVATGSTVFVTKSLGPPPKKKVVKKSPPRRKRSGGRCSGDCSRCHPGR